MLLLVCLSDCVCLSLCYLFYCVTMGLYPIQINGMEMEWNGMEYSSMQRCYSQVSELLTADVINY